MNINHRQVREFSGSQSTRISTDSFRLDLETIAALLILIFPIMGTFFAPESYFAPQDFSIEGADNRDVGFPFGRIAFMIVIVWEFYLFWRLPQSFSRGLRRAALPLAYILWSLITGYWTLDPSLSMNRSLRVLIICVFAAYLAERFTPKELLRLIAISGAVAVGASIFAAIVLPQYGRTTLIGYEGAWRGATLHKNALGALMATIFTFSWFAYRTHTVEKRLGMFLFLGSLFLIVMARSVTALITGALSAVLIIYFGFISRLRNASEKAIVLISGILGLCLLYVGQSLLDLFLQALGRNSDFTGRRDVWNVAWELIQRKPIWGYGSSFWSIDSPDRAYAWRVLGWAPPHSHNNFLDVWLQLGLPGLALMCSILLILVYRISIILLKNHPDIDLIWPVIITTTFFGGLTETNLVENSGGIFWVTLAYIMIDKLSAQPKSV